eukprot:1144713-Heterocapsa_arctica.AAC.1
MSAETRSLCKQCNTKLLLDPNEIRVNEESKLRPDEKAKNCNLNDQLKTKIEAKNGLENYCFTMYNTLNEEEKSEGDDKENINSFEHNQIVIFVKCYVKLDEQAII